jgi:SAM-dependent methyltransferase
MKALGHHVTGLDMVQEALDIAMRENRIDEAIHGDFLATDLPQGSYDVIVFWGILLYIFDLDAVFRSAAGVLRPGGEVLLADHHSANPYTKLHFARPDWVDRLIEGRSNTARRALNRTLVVEASEKYFEWGPTRYWSHFTRHPHRGINFVHMLARAGFAGLHSFWRPPWSYNFISMCGTVRMDAVGESAARLGGGQ